MSNKKEISIYFYQKLIRSYLFLFTKVAINYSYLSSEQVSFTMM